MRTRLTFTLFALVFCTVQLFSQEPPEASGLKIFFDFTTPVTVDPSNMEAFGDPLSLVGPNDSLDVYALCSVSNKQSVSGYHLKLGTAPGADDLMSGVVHSGELGTGRHSGAPGQVKLYLGRFKKQAAFYLELKIKDTSGAFGVPLTYSTN